MTSLLLKIKIISELKESSGKTNSNEWHWDVLNNKNVNRNYKLGLHEEHLNDS
jgi:hypothetical protein